jgi:hypothetical protein
MCRNGGTALRRAAEFRSQTYRLDVFRDPHDGDTWICRRDHSIRLPYERVIEMTSDGVPFMAPEIVLLFKAKHARPKDEADFAGTLDALGPAQRAWLATRWQGFIAGTRGCSFSDRAPLATCAAGLKEAGLG